MDENIVRILASYGCKYMADDDKEMIEEIEAYVKNREKQLHIPLVSQQRELLIAFLEMNNWFSLEDRKNAEGIVDCYLKAINCG